jgi:hypothetical protein
MHATKVILPDGTTCFTKHPEKLLAKRNIHQVGDDLHVESTGIKYCVVDRWRFPHTQLITGTKCIS